MAEERRYSDQEVRAILDRALKNQGPGDDGLAHADLLAIGEQIGVSAEAMSRAAEELVAAQLDETATRAVTSRRLRWLAAHAAVFTLLNGVLYAVNAATTPGEWWVLFPIVFWGLALTVHAALSLGTSVSASALEQERRKLEGVSRARRSRLRVEQAAPEPDAAVLPDSEQLTRQRLR